MEKVKYRKVKTTTDGNWYAVMLRGTTVGVIKPRRYYGIRDYGTWYTGWAHDGLKNGYFEKRWEAAADLLVKNGYDYHHAFPKIKADKPDYQANFKYDYTGPDGRSRKEKNDCVPSAISYVTQIPYWKVMDTLYANDRPHIPHEPNSGWNEGVYLKTIKKLGYDVTRKYVRDTPELQCGGQSDRRPTPSRFCREMADPNKLYLINSYGHLIGVRNAKTNHGKRFRIYQIFELTKRED